MPAVTTRPWPSTTAKPALVRARVDAQNRTGAARVACTTLAPPAAAVKTMTTGMPRVMRIEVFGGKGRQQVRSGLGRFVAASAHVRESAATADVVGKKRRHPERRASIAT